METKWEKQKSSNKCMGSGYGAGILNWNTKVERDWIEKCGQKIKENNDNVWSFTPKSDVDRLNVKSKEGGIGMMSVKRCIKEEENNLSFYVANCEENLIRAVAVYETIKTKDTVMSREFKKQKA